MTKSRKQSSRTLEGVGEPSPVKLSELLAALPPLADAAFPDEIPDVPSESVERF